MSYYLILIGCFIPLIVIIIVTKFAMLLSSSVTEANYVKAESKRPHGPYVADAYADIDEEDSWGDL